MNENNKNIKLNVLEILYGRIEKCKINYVHFLKTDVGQDLII